MNPVKFILYRKPDLIRWPFTVLLLKQTYGKITFLSLRFIYFGVWSHCQHCVWDHRISRYCDITDPDRSRIAPALPSLSSHKFPIVLHLLDMEWDKSRVWLHTLKPASIIGCEYMDENGAVMLNLCGTLTKACQTFHQHLRKFFHLLWGIKKGNIISTLNCIPDPWKVALKS